MTQSQQVLDNRTYHFETVTIDGHECEMVYIKKFKLVWFASRLNLFIIIRKTDEVIDKKLIDSFSRSCYQYALNNYKGIPRGFQAAVASIAILKGKNVDDSAIKFCEYDLRKHWSAFEIPVVYDTDRKVGFRFKSKPAWGYLFFPYLEKTLNQIELD